jgi:hypothetical protein
MLARFTQTLLKNRFFAIGAVFLCALPSLVVNPDHQVLSAITSLITTMSIVIAAFITLEKGLFDGFLATIAATLPGLASFFVFPLSGDAYFGLSVIQLSGLIILSNVLIKAAGNWSKLLQFTTCLSLLVLLGVYAFYPHVDKFWADKLSQNLNSSFKLMDEFRGGDGSSGSIALGMFVSMAKDYASGFIIIMFMVNILFQLGLARIWQATEFNLINLRTELYNIHLGGILGGIFVACLALSLWHIQLIIAIMPIFYVVFALAGLSLMHYVASLVKGGKICLGISYSLIIILPTIFLVLIAMIGLLDTWINLRVKAKNFINIER